MERVPASVEPLGMTDRDREISPENLGRNAAFSRGTARKADSRSDRETATSMLPRSAASPHSPTGSPLAEGALPGSESAGKAAEKRRKAGKKRGFFIAVLFGIFPPIVYHVVSGRGRQERTGPAAGASCCTGGK